MSYVFQTIRSPVGRLKLVASGKGLAGIVWENDNESRVPHLQNAIESPEHPVLGAARRQLDEYFTGKRKNFVLDLDFEGSNFNQKVWKALLSIPYGQTRTYGQIARDIGNPEASRAVGTASGKNPISIVAPCHRVIGANGKLTGFAGGLEAKAYLLHLETQNLFNLPKAA